jgi:protein SCO1
MTSPPRPPHWRIPSAGGTCRLAALAALLVLAGCRERYEPHGTYLDPPMEVPGFTLTSAEGPVSRDDLQGNVVVMFFGFAACPDVCPDTMSRLRQALSMLTPEEARQVRVLLVSVDPERDTPEAIGRYASVFGEQFTGLTGTPEEIAQVTARYGIFHERTALEGGGYTVDHTAATTVLNRRGETVLIWSYGTAPEAMAEDLRFLLRRS